MYWNISFQVVFKCQKKEKIERKQLIVLLKSEDNSILSECLSSVYIHHEDLRNSKTWFIACYQDILGKAAHRSWGNLYKWTSHLMQNNDIIFRGLPIICVKSCSCPNKLEICL